MAIKTQTFHIAICDVCGAEFDETGDYRHWDTSPEAALNQIRYVEDDTDWLIVGEATVVCPASDTPHYLARGGESPALLRPSRDAACYTAPLASELIAEAYDAA